MLFSAAFKFRTSKATFTFDSIEKLEKFCSLVQRDFPNLMFYVFNRSKPTPAPKGWTSSRAKKGVIKLWCPYCAEPRMFRTARFNKKYRVCEICGVSDAEYYVKKENQLWETVIISEDGTIQTRRFGKNSKARKTAK